MGPLIVVVFLLALGVTALLLLWLSQPSDKTDPRGDNQDTTETAQTIARRDMKHLIVCRIFNRSQVVRLIAETPTVTDVSSGRKVSLSPVYKTCPNGTFLGCTRCGKVWDAK